MLPLCKKHVVGLRWKTIDWFLYDGKIAIKLMSLMWPPAVYASSKPALEMIILLNTCKVNPVFPNFPFDPPENIRKPLVFWYFQGDQKRTLGRNGLAIKTYLCC